MAQDSGCVIVTGAAKGIGYSIAQRLVADGRNVIMTDVADGKEQAACLGRLASFKRLDVADENSWKTVVDAVILERGSIDGLVNNAGIFAFGLVDEMAPTDFRRIIEIDLVGSWLGMNAVIPHMKRERRGSIVNIASSAGIMGFCGASAYSAAKFGVRGVTKSAAKELGPFGVRVNTVNPGNTDTDMLRSGIPVDAQFKDIFPEVAMNRPAQASEIAAVVSFLLGEQASYINGADINVDGGWTTGIYTSNKPSPD